MNGFGSLSTTPNSCDAAERQVAANAGNNAIGCYFFNPFSREVFAEVLAGIVEADPPGAVSDAKIGATPGASISTKNVTNAAMACSRWSAVSMVTSASEE